MNIVDIIILAVLAFSLFAGMYKGFLASLLQTACFVGSWFGAQYTYTFITRATLGNASLMATLKNYLEPASFFSSIGVANTTVTEAAAQGEGFLRPVFDTISEKLPFIGEAFENNVINKVFTNLRIDTLADYLDQTIWQAAFNVMAFVVAFVIIYILSNLLVNLFNHVFRFPVLRHADWLAGGFFGLLRGVVVVILLMCVLEPIVSVFSKPLVDTLISESRLYNIALSADVLNVRKWVNGLIMLS